MRTAGGSMVVMRSDEMLLNAAGSLCAPGKDTEAKALLWQLQDLRVRAYGSKWR